MHILAWTSCPSTSAVGSASANPSDWASDRGLGERGEVDERRGEEKRREEERVRELGG